ELRLNGLAQILQNMEAVGDLTRLRRAFMGALGERTATIAADQLDVRILLKPISCRARRTNRQKVDHFPPLQVHDDGSISGALAPRPVIDPNHSNICSRAPFLCSPLEMAQDRIIAGRHADALHHALAWPTPNAMTEKMNEFLGSPGSMRLRRGNLRQLFHKRLPLA